MSAEERELWRRVEELWALAKQRDEVRIRALLHPDYVGWDLSAATPHDREAAVRSVCAPSAQLGDYELKLASIRIYGSQVGVVHYSYSASVTADGMPPRQVTGRWTEVYLGDDLGWKMISVSGLPDPLISASRAARAAP